ncbi:MAG TPA: hypothetical protein VGM83_10965 [Devosiaceae bacterium]|jgi:hypothetical protein
MPEEKLIFVARIVRRTLGAGLLVATLGACSMGNMFGSGPGDISQYANATANQKQIAQAAPNALPAIATECPPIKVRPGSETLYSYVGGKVGNAADLHYQAVIDKQTRNCIVSNGLITVQMGVAGRVLLGPKGSEKSVNVPVRFAVERNGAAIFTEKYVLPTAIDASTQTGSFLKVLDNVAIPYIGGEDITIWVGFDPK